MPVHVLTSMLIANAFYKTCVEVTVSGNDTEKSELWSWRHQEHIKLEECFRPFSSEYFVFPSPI